MSKPKCQCRPGCPFSAADGEPYALAHDPRPEKQDERRKRMSALGVVGIAASAKARSRAKRKELVINGAADYLAEAKQIYLKLWNSAAQDVTKAPVLMKILSETRAFSRLADLEAENEWLRAFVKKHHPEEYEEVIRRVAIRVVK